VAPAGKTGDNHTMLRRLALALVLLATPAHADILKLFAEAHGGAMAGEGTGGDQKDAAFFAHARHPMYGALVGAEFLIFDAWIQHHQYTNGSELATWTQFGVGIHNQISLASEQDQKAGKGTFLDLGTGAWFGLGTGRQVMPPLDNAQITDKGFLIEARIGFGTHLSSLFDFGVALPISWGYFLKNGAMDAANDLGTHYQGVQGELLLYLRANIKLL
jgi:hypothetical protein